MRGLLAISVLTIVLFTFVGHAQQAQQPRRAVPDDNLAYPVLITLRSGGTGSGFYLGSKSETYLVTAKHVLFNQKTGNLLDTSFELLSYSKDVSDQTPNIFTIDTTKMAADAIVKHPTEDIVVVKVFGQDPADASLASPRPGVTVNVHAKLGILQVGLENVKKLSDVLVGNQVFLFGYPTSLALQDMPQIDPRRPLLRRGVVAGQNPRTRSIILDCPAYFGNSGGPVVEVDEEAFLRHFTVIGVVQEYVPYADGGRTFAIMANSGYSVAIPMDFVLELVK